MVPVKLVTTRARRLYEQGVMAVYSLGNGQNAALVGVFYGETGGHQREGAAQKTDDIIDVLMVRSSQLLAPGGKNM